MIRENPTPSGEVYGKEDSRFWMTKENYAPDRANHIEFQKQYKEASEFTAFSMWFNYAGVPLITAGAGVVAKGIQIVRTPYSGSAFNGPLKYVDPAPSRKPGSFVRLQG